MNDNNTPDKHIKVDMDDVYKALDEVTDLLFKIIDKQNKISEMVRKKEEKEEKEEKEGKEERVLPYKNEAEWKAALVRNGVATPEQIEKYTPRK